VSEQKPNRRGHRVTVAIDESDLAELRKRAQRDRLPLATAFLIAARDGFGRPAQPRRPASWDEGYDHSLQQELLVLNLLAIEQAIKLIENVTPYGQGADQFLVEAARAAQQRIARGIPEALQGRSNGQR
jgi:hypothetical protein